MKWKKKYNSLPEGTERIVRRFSWFPVNIQGETRWLEFAWIKQKYTFFSGAIHVDPGYFWENMSFVDSEQDRSVFWAAEAEKHHNDWISKQGEFLAEVIGENSLPEDPKDYLKSKFTDDDKRKREKLLRWAINSKDMADDIDSDFLKELLAIDNPPIHSVEMPKEYIKLLIGKETPVVFDIGSYNGLDIAQIAHLHKGGSWFCFDADDRNIQMIKNTSELIKGSFYINKFAIGNVDGLVEFYPSHSMTRKHEGNPVWSASGSMKKPKNHINLFPDVDFESEPIQVECKKLDTYFKSVSGLFTDLGKTIDFIWCDVNGAEEEVILGGIETLSRHTRYLYIEFSDKELYEGQITKERILKLLPNFELLSIWNFRGNFGNLLLRNTCLVNKNV